MIGLIAMAGVAVWLAIVSYLYRLIPLPLWLKANSLITKAARLILFAALLVLPIADELIGRWQFKKLCQREAVVWLSPDWDKVKRARDESTGPTHLNGHVIRIREWHSKYVDIDTGRKFLESKTFITNGGLLLDRLGLGLGAATSCSPSDKFQIFHMVNIDQLLKTGK